MKRVQKLTPSNDNYQIISLLRLARLYGNKTEEIFEEEEKQEKKNRTLPENGNQPIEFWLIETRTTSHAKKKPQTHSVPGSKENEIDECIQKL